MTDPTFTMSSSPPSSSTGRSSQELSAAAVESVRKAQAQADLQNDLETQIAALRAQQEEAARSAQQHLEQAKAEEQAAKKQAFHEVGLEKKEAFRNGIADEVLTRVAQTLQSEEDRKYMQAIADGRPGFEKPTEFKAMLWEAIAGDDYGFLRAAADKVQARYKTDIMDADIDQITSSFVCLKEASIQRAGPPAPPASAKVRKESQVLDIDETIMTETYAEETFSASALVVDASEPQNHDSTQHDSSATEVRPPVLSAASIAARIKQESRPLETGEASYRFMSELDDDNEAINAVRATITNTTGSPIRLDSVLDHDLETSPTRGRPANNLMSKRVRDDDSVASRESASSKTSKRVRITVEGPGGTAKVQKFVSHIGSLAADGKLHVSDLQCTNCRTDTKKDLRITSCLHLYCNQCLKTVRQGVSGKEANKMACVYSGCGKETGKPNIVPVKVIEDLKAKHAVDVGGYETAATED